MVTDPLAIVASTADAAFATDEEERIVIWNKAAERLLGFAAEQVLGKPCHEILCGRDVFGNRYCDELCPLARMVQHREPVRHFELDVRRESGQVARVGVSVIVVPGPKASQFTIVHLLQPMGLADERRPASSVRTPPPPAAIAPLQEDPPDLRALTARELEVLRVLAEGSSTAEIADKLFISVATVRNHTQSILRKLAVHSKLEAVSLALRHRLI